MSRLIDVDAMKNWLEIVPLTGDGGVDINDLMKYIDLMSTTREWIPCSEAMPKVGKNVLLSVSGVCAAEGCLRADGNWAQFRWNGIQPKSKVDAWMLLPEPYKEKE